MYCSEGGNNDEKEGFFKRLWNRIKERFTRNNVKPKEEAAPVFPDIAPMETETLQTFEERVEQVSQSRPEHVLQSEPEQVSQSKTEPSQQQTTKSEPKEKRDEFLEELRKHVDKEYRVELTAQQVQKENDRHRINNEDSQR